jgi:two-component system, NtrC family, sensor histidine kinase HydH
LAAIGEMGAAVAHGIRNPLASIRSAAELAREEDPEGADECLRDILAEADRLDRWVRQLLAASRETLQATEAVDLNDVIGECLGAVAAEARRHGIELKRTPGPLPRVRGSHVSLVHAFGSIMANAVEAMPLGGCLRVESRATENGWVRVAVEDTGSGIAAGVAGHVFRPLFTTKPNGIGLGLSLSRRILERHGGRIEFESIDARGTRVVLTLPVLN